MDDLIQVSEILSNYLTTESLKLLYPSFQKVDNVPGFIERAKRSKLFLDLLEHAGEAVERKLNRELTTEELILVYRRVNQFLVARGLD